MRAVRITLLFVAAMLYLGIQAAQTEPNPPNGVKPTVQTVAVTGAG